MRTDLRQVRSNAVGQLDFESVLFTSALIGYDYIMGLISRFSQQTPGEQKMCREQLIGLIQSDAKFMNQREEIAAYIATLKAGDGIGETVIRDGYTRFEVEKNAAELAAIAAKHFLAPAALQRYVDCIFDRMIFDGERLATLWLRGTSVGGSASRPNRILMQDLLPLLIKRAQGREISGLNAYDQ